MRNANHRKHTQETAEADAGAEPARGDRALSVGEACHRLAVGRNTVYGLINSGELKTLSVGRRRLIPESQIDALLARAS